MVLMLGAATEPRKEHEKKQIDSPKSVATSGQSAAMNGERLVKASRLKIIPCSTKTEASLETGLLQQFGPVAQLVSASPCHGEGRRFKSDQGRQNS